MTAAAPISIRCGGVNRLSRPTALEPKIGDQKAWSTIQAAPKIRAAAKVPVWPSGRARFHTRPSRSPVAKAPNRNSVISAHEAVTVARPAFRAPSIT